MGNNIFLDIRMKVVDYEEALLFLNELPGQWIYIKHLNDTQTDDLKEQITTYTKFKVRNVDALFGTILIYGEEDEDRLTIDKDSILSYQMTPNRDELYVQIRTADNYTNVYIKKYLPNIKYRLNEILQSSKNLIITEGKTDWKHLKNALLHFQSQGWYRDIQFDFFEYEENMGDDKLRKVREYNQLFYNAGLKIFIFDADNPEIIEAHKGQEFVDWGNNVFSFIIPVPESRKNTPLISIEHYYSDDEIKTLDKNNRRLYINSEFDYETGILNSNSRIIKIKHSKDSEMTENHIIDDEVFCVPEQIEICKKNIYRIKTECDKVSLSKNRFVEYIIRGEESFRNFNLDNFKLIFDIVSKIQYENMNGRLCDQEDSINYIEVSPIAHIRTFDNELKVLEICIPESEHTLQLRDRECFGVDINILEEGVQFLLDWGKGKIKIPLPLNTDLLDFLHDKAANHYNRIELQLYSDSGTRIIEILNGDLASGLIELKLQRFYL